MVVVVILLVLIVLGVTALSEGPLTALVGIMVSVERTVAVRAK